MSEIDKTGIGDSTYFQVSYGSRSPTFYRWLLAEVILFGRPGSILDLGCGTGLFMELAAKWRLDVFGFDGSTEALKMALKRCPSLKVQQAYLSQALPCEDECFDNVVLNQVVEHLPPPVLVNALSEVHRVLKKDGVLFVFSPNKSNKKEVNKDPTHCNPLYPSELRNHLKCAGFIVINEPNTSRMLQKYRLSRKVSALLLKTRFADWMSATANAYALRP